MARNVAARSVVARDVVARDVVARDVVARDVVARDVVARDVVARGGERLLRMEFDVAELPLLRGLIADGVLRAGLDGTANGAFVQAAWELAAHAVTHDGGTGTTDTRRTTRRTTGCIELRVLAGELRCEVADSGPGFLSARPDAHGPRLARSLVRSLAGRLELHATPQGTTATLSVRVPTPIPMPTAAAATVC
ncbi:ATP-binding protein [Streptomyces capitiformicae]|uniref:ATP-binding protein n=1 Tax=Streptomyces capitiformicae TaxID=2014920 RepID=UPI001E3805C5|nr:hypothetical protein [Streptomyces capitiformicae]